MNGEVKLWRAVLRQAIRDVWKRKKNSRPQVAEWFSQNNADFNMVCELAQVIPDRLERVIKEKFSCKK